MSAPFDVAAPGRIRFGDGVVQELPELAARHGRVALLVTGASPERHAAVRASLEARGLTIVRFRVASEPTTEDAERGVRLAREAAADVVIGLGGGSALDCGKAIAALLTNGGVPLDYLEGIGAGRPLTEPSTPYLAVPTTAGTGAEATKNAVLASTEHAVKVSLRSDFMLPTVALVDPELTHSVPPEVTASTGLDALTQVLEPFVSNASNPFTDALAREGMARAARSLRRAYDDGRDAEARRDMALTSLFGGLALANAKLGAVHGFAGPIGGAFPSPHGAVCARLLPFVIDANVRALRQRAPSSPVLARYDEVARILTGRADAVAEDAVDWTLALSEALRVPPLRTYGVTEAALEELADKSGRASSMRGNPIVLTPDERIAILALAS